MPIIVSDFFERYAQAYRDFDTEVIVDKFGLPSIVMTDDRKLIMISVDNVTAEIDRVLDRYREMGVVDFELSVQQVLKISDKLRFCNVDWILRNSAGEEIVNTCTSYTLQRTEDDGFEIVAMIVNEEDDAYYDSVEQYGTANEGEASK